MRYEKQCIEIIEVTQKYVKTEAKINLDDLKLFRGDHYKSSGFPLMIGFVTCEVNMYLMKFSHLKMHQA